MLESGARVPPHCVEAARFRLRAVQAISDCSTPPIKLRFFRIPYRLPSTFPCKLQAQDIVHGTTPYCPTIPQLSVEWYRCARQGEVTRDAPLQLCGQHLTCSICTCHILHAVQHWPSMLIYGAANGCDRVTLFVNATRGLVAVCSPNGSRPHKE